MNDDNLVTWEQMRREAVEAMTGFNHTGSFDDHEPVPKLRYLELILMGIDMAAD